MVFGLLSPLCIDIKKPILSEFADIAYYDNMNVVWNPSDAGPWPAFHAQGDGALQQAWAYGEALKAMEVEVQRAMVWEGTRLLAVAQFMCRRVAGYLSVASCTRGPVWAQGVNAQDRQQIYRLLQKSIPLARVKVVLFSPNESLDEVSGLNGYRRVMTGYSTVMMDLKQPLPALRAALDGKWRNRLVKVQAHEKIRCHVLPSRKRCEGLLGQEVEQREAKKFHGLPVEFVRHYIDKAADPAQAFAVAYAELGKNTIASMLFLVHGRVASYHMGWADAEGRQLNAHNALLWQAMAYFQDRQMAWLDLGGVNTQDLPGISRFKLGTGGRVLTLAGTYF